MLEDALKKARMLRQCLGAESEVNEKPVREGAYKALRVAPVVKMFVLPCGQRGEYEAVII